MQGYGLLTWVTWFQVPHLKWVEEEREEDLDVAQDASGLLISGEDEDDLMDAK